ncbi:MAG: HAAS signaling domain-containing protein, partial [Planctomycetota bacterium]
MKPESPALTRYLDEVSAHLGRAKGKRDVLLELESAILDRAEEIGKGDADPESIEKALDSVGDPAEVAVSFTGEKYLVGPRVYRPFLIYTGILFVIHVVMIAVASVLEADIEVLPVLVFRVPTPHTLLNLLAVALQALLVDIGLMVVIFTGIGRVQQTVRLPRLAFRVETGLRASLTRVVLAVLVLVLLNVLRDDLFIVVLEHRVHPIFTSSFVSVLPYLDVFLALVIVRELAYAVLGERPRLVVADGALLVVGAALMIWFLTRESFISFPVEV